MYFSELFHFKTARAARNKFQQTIIYLLPCEHIFPFSTSRVQREEKKYMLLVGDGHACGTYNDSINVLQNLYRSFIVFIDFTRDRRNFIGYLVVYKLYRLLIAPPYEQSIKAICVYRLLIDGLQRSYRQAYRLISSVYKSIGRAYKAPMKRIGTSINNLQTVYRKFIEWERLALYNSYKSLQMMSINSLWFQY